MRLVVTGATGNVGTAVVRALNAVRSDATGAFNIAAAPVVDSQLIADLVDARQVPAPAQALWAAAAGAFALRLTPTEPDWLDLALRAQLIYFSPCWRLNPEAGEESTRYVPLTN